MEQGIVLTYSQQQVHEESSNHCLVGEGVHFFFGKYYGTIKYNC